MGDLKTSWPIVIAGAFIALVVGFLFLFFLRYFAGVLAWSSIFIFLAILASGTYMAHTKEKDAANKGESTNESLFLAAKIVLGISTLIFFVVCLFLRKRINLAIDVTKEGTRAVTDMKSMLLLPFFKFAILLILFAYWVWVAVNLASAGEMKVVDVSQVPGIDVPGGKLRKFTYDETLRYAALYHFFGLLWTCAFLIYLTDLIISGAVSAWYFADTVNDEKKLDSPVKSSVAIALRYHVGTVAFGALVLAIIQFIRAILAYLQKQMKNVIVYYYYKDRKKRIILSFSFSFCLFMPFFKIIKGSKMD